MESTFSPSPADIVAYLVAINVAAFGAFGIDKTLARAGGWRIPESTLLSLAFFGGTTGAYAGRRFFYHKTSKRPFSDLLHAIAMLQTIALLGFLIWYAL